jgi:outer membrane cobalamin receptor
MLRACGLALLLVPAQFGQSSTGELRLSVQDPAGLPLQASVTLVSQVNEISQHLETDSQGKLVAKRLPFGRYRLEISRTGFAPEVELLDVQSILPLEHHVTLSLSPVQAQVDVSSDETLLDVHQIGTQHRIGAETLQRRVTASPGRALSSVVNTQPGWLLEANGILHPRGSEYQVQYVVDGLPITDNRSPSFAPEFDAEDVHSMNILTGGYPPEYGRKLGGVVEVVTAADRRNGFHGSAAASAGTFETFTGSAVTQYGWGRNLLGVSAAASHTDRYLDPPVEENFTNNGTGSTLTLHAEREFSDADRLGVIGRHGQMHFLVPNERVQEEAGQRQERSSQETSAQISYQHVFSANLLGDLRGVARTVSARLSSNPFATPIAAEQDRGFREAYLKGTLAGRIGSHEWKAGIDADFGNVHEAFAYKISDPSQFDASTPLSFSFADRARDREQGLFIQDRVRMGSWTVNAGLRWDRYRLLVEQSALSPRVGIAWSWPAADLVVRASYDRAFQTPAIENLLLASSPAVEGALGNVTRLPVRPSAGNFFEAGVSKRFFSKMHLDVTHFSRGMTNFADDDLLLNTGVSFPIAFRRAEIQGTELKLEVPRWRALSGFVSYTNMTGWGFLPVTGGLFLGEDAATALTNTDRFPISQDQRHTVRGRVGCQLSERTWIALAASYGSGLPVEFVGDEEQAVAQFGQRIVDRVDLDRGRVRPSASIDASASVVVLKTDTHRLRVQADVLNLANRLDVINFAGLFSGTALAPPRSLAIRVHVEF